jgi:hypothetical protein
MPNGAAAAYDEDHAVALDVLRRRLLAAVRQPEAL